MTNVHTTYRLIQPAGHHRQPRGTASSVQLIDLGTSPGIPGESGTANAPSTYDTNSFVFWSVSDGAAGFTQTNRNLTYQVSAAPMELTAWYLPPGGIGKGEGTAYLIDAFSVAAGDFVDDDFVTVTSDPSLTSQANVAGVVPTTDTETAQAFGSVGSEDFEHWIGASSAVGRDATFTEGHNGFAIATYKRGEPMRIPKVDVPRTGGILIGHADIDGGGILILPGGGVSPIDPWGPLLERLLKAIALGRLSAGMKGDAARQVQDLAAEQIAAAGAAIIKRAGVPQR